jgi:ABC-type sugar transport system substrate-binding protein
MKNIGKVVAISALLGFLALMVIPVNAVPARPAQLSGEAGERLTGLVDKFEEQGYDMSAVRAAIESGDIETARTLIHQFMEEHRDEFSAPPDGVHAGNGERLTGLVDKFEEQGYDMSAVKAAIESGDIETVRTLMQQFMDENGDEFPAPPDSVHAGNGERMRPGMAL